MNGIAGLQVAPGEDSIGVQREIGDRERTDAVKCPNCETFHSPGLDRTRQKSQPGTTSSELPRDVPHRHADLGKLRRILVLIDGDIAPLPIGQRRGAC